MSTKLSTPAPSVNRVAKDLSSVPLPKQPFSEQPLSAPPLNSANFATISKQMTYKPFRITSFAHPHHLNPFLSHPSEKQGGGG